MTRDIWASFRALPLWVQLWIALVLLPVNFVSVAFWAEPRGPLLAVLAIGGIAPNAVLMLAERGFSRAMAFSHVVLWVPLFLFVLSWLHAADAPQGGFRTYLWALLAVNGVSLAFDFRDACAWSAGSRGVAGREQRRNENGPG